MAAALDLDAASHDSGYCVFKYFESDSCDLSICSADALQQFKQWVNRQSRHLSMSRHDREEFFRVTEKYFSELEDAFANDAKCFINEMPGGKTSPFYSSPQSSLKKSYMQLTGKESQCLEMNTAFGTKNTFKSSEMTIVPEQASNNGFSVFSSKTARELKVNADGSNFFKAEPLSENELNLTGEHQDYSTPASGSSCFQRQKCSRCSSFNETNSTVSKELHSIHADIREFDNNEILGSSNWSDGRENMHRLEDQLSNSPGPTTNDTETVVSIYSHSLETNSEEYKSMALVLTHFLEEQDDYFESLPVEDHCKLLLRLLLYQLEVEQKANLSHKEEIEVALSFYSSVRNASLSPHTFRLVYETARMGDARLCIENIANRYVSDLNEVFLYDGLLLSCLQTFVTRTTPSTFEKLKFGIFGTCTLCILEGKLIVLRSCCNEKVCFECYSQWVTTKVLSRTIEVGCPCCEAFLTAQEIVEMLGEKSHRYTEILTDLNGNPNAKTCPQCNQVTQAPKQKPNRQDGGQVVRCDRCNFSWCFRCHSPLHAGITCKVNHSGALQLRDWGAGTYFDGSQLLRKARKCPSCKVWIEKNQGCNHITCNRCYHEFCYVCGKNWRGGNIVFGKHSNRLSIFGCKQNFLPNRPLLRKLVRGAIFVLQSIGIVIGIPVILGLLIGLSPILGIIGLAVLIYKCKH